MPPARLTLREEDVVRLALEFLHNRELHISQLSLERETGVINGNFSDDILFLRQLILDGQWDDALEFVQPLEAIRSFDHRKFSYSVLKHKYVELLCIKSEATLQGNGVDSAVDEVVKVLSDLEKYAPSKDEYSAMCLLLTLPRLNDHLQYKDWNPSSARVQCFREIYPLVSEYLPGDRKNVEGTSLCNKRESKNDRLIQLVIKGILYESCVNYCQAKATSANNIISASSTDLSFTKVLDDGAGFSDSDLSLLSWLQSVSSETFSVPFEQRTLSVDVERLERPSLETSWTEHMLVTPIKPKTFPHSAMPFTRPRSAADLMTRSLLPAIPQQNLSNNVNDLSRSSFASFHLTGIRGTDKIMNASVDRLFDNENANENMILASSSYGEFRQLPSIKEQSNVVTSTPNKSTNVLSGASTPERKNMTSGRDSPLVLGGNNSTRGSRRDSLNERPLPKENEMLEYSFSGELVKEFQKTRQRLQDAMAAREKEREEALNAIKDESKLRDRPTNGNHINMVPKGSNVGAKMAQNGGGDVYGTSGKSPEPILKCPIFTMSNRLDALFSTPADVKNVKIEVEEETSVKCDVHGGQRRGSTPHSHAHMKRDYVNPMGSRRGSMPSLSAIFPNGGVVRRRDSFGLPAVAPHKDLEHPSQFSATLRNFGGSTSNLSAKNHLQVPFGGMRRNSRNYSTDSLDNRRSSWDPGRRGSSGSSCGFDDENRQTTARSSTNTDPDSSDNGTNNNSNRPRFVPVTSLEDVQAVRCAEFHPSGQLYAVGSNSKTLRICSYPKLNDIREDHQTYQPTVLFKRTKHHKGSIYCLAWSPVGDLMATGSNDKTVKLMRFNADTSNLEGEEIELTMHDGTVRDLCFLEDATNKSSLLISGGAGDCKIYVTDCATGTPFQALSGHTGHILALYTWGGAMFVSGSHDRSVRFWDLRTRGCVNVVTPSSGPNGRPGSAVASLCVDPSGRLLVSGHEDGACVLYDIRGGRGVQCFRPHAADIRSIRFSPSAYYLLSGGYDGKLVLTDLQGDLTLPLPSVVVAQHSDKVISGRWHPSDFSFLSTSADKTATLWALPPV